jgi:hypothetical protein
MIYTKRMRERIALEWEGRRPLSLSSRCPRKTPWEARKTLHKPTNSRTSSTIKIHLTLLMVPNRS